MIPLTLRVSDAVMLFITIASIMALTVALAALVTVTPMARGGDEIADEAREVLAETFDAETTPVEVGRDE